MGWILDRTPSSQGRCGDAEEAERMEEDQTVTWFCWVQGENPGNIFQRQFVFVNMRWWNQKQTATTTAATTKRIKKESKSKITKLFARVWGICVLQQKGRFFFFETKKKTDIFERDQRSEISRFEVERLWRTSSEGWMDLTCTTTPRACRDVWLDLYVLGSKLPLFPYNRGWSSTQ